MPYIKQFLSVTLVHLNVELFEEGTALVEIEGTIVILVGLLELSAEPPRGRNEAVRGCWDCYSSSSSSNCCISSMKNVLL